MPRPLNVACSLIGTLRRCAPYAQANSFSPSAYAVAARQTPWVKFGWSGGTEINTPSFFEANGMRPA